MCLKMKMDSELLPNIENCDPFNYPVLGTSAYTSNLFKAYKCSEAFETFPKNVIEMGRILDDLDVAVQRGQYYQSTTILWEMRVNVFSCWC